MILGEFLKKYRKAMGYSGRVLAEKMDVSRHLLEKWENANYTPNAEDTEKIKNHLGLKTLVSLDEKILKKCIIGVAPVAEDLLKQKDRVIHEMEKRIRYLEKLVARQENVIDMLKAKSDEIEKEVFLS